MPGSARRGSGRPQPRFIEVEYRGQVHRIALKRIATARRFTLRVRSARRDVVLTIPTSGSAAAARSFALRHAGWIADRLAGLSQGVPFEPGRMIPFRGEMHRLLQQTGLRKRVVVTTGSDGPQICVSGPGSFPAMLQRFLHEQAEAELSAAAGRHAARVGRTVHGLTLRDTRTRWGSCSSRGALSFSWRLILAPPFVLDYLAAHEVAHLVEMNHSPAFWRVVRTLYSDVDGAERWLKRNGASLHLYGVSSPEQGRDVDPA